MMGASQKHRTTSEPSDLNTPSTPALPLPPHHPGQHPSVPSDLNQRSLGVKVIWGLKLGGSQRPKAMVRIKTKAKGKEEISICHKTQERDLQRRYGLAWVLLLHSCVSLFPKAEEARSFPSSL